MKLQLEWSKPIALKDASRENLIYKTDLEKLPDVPGVYIFGRRWGRSQFEALYVGKANRIKGRVKGHFNNLRLMQHLRNAKNGKRIILTGRIVTRPGQQLDKCLKTIERGFIRYFLSEGHDLVNKQGTRLRRHEIASSGKHPKRFFPGVCMWTKQKVNERPNQPIDRTPGKRRRRYSVTSVAGAGHGQRSWPAGGGGIGFSARASCLPAFAL